MPLAKQWITWPAASGKDAAEVDRFASLTSRRKAVKCVSSGGKCIHVSSIIIIM